MNNWDEGKRRLVTLFPSLFSTLNLAGKFPKVQGEEKANCGPATLPPTESVSFAYQNLICFLIKV